MTFYVPGTQLAPAYYAWWVGTQSGRVLQETMVSRFHYMVWNYTDFISRSDRAAAHQGHADRGRRVTTSRSAQ